ncbi:RsiV family protein [Acetivibrio clariflavus]|nr:RsiV family protein [Acetivibrio clariflavus]
MKNWKKKFLLLIAINIVFATSGCGLSSVSTTNVEQPTQTPSYTNESKDTPVPEQETASPQQKTVNFSTFEVNKKYFNDAEGFAELNLKLPKLDGNYAGIDEINRYFAEKEEFFYEELPLDLLKEFNEKVEGQKDNWFRSADYSLEVVFGNIISMKAYLDGGAGGVSWAGIEGDTFDLDTGKKLALKDIFKVNEDEYMNFIYDFVSEKIMNDINNNKEAHDYLFDDPYSGEGYKSIRNFNPDDFYLSKDSLVVFYPKYALSIGAAGPIVFEIPYEKISDMLAIDIKSNVSKYDDKNVSDTKNNIIVDIQ